MFKVNNRNTGIQCEIWSKLINFYIPREFIFAEETVPQISRELTFADMGKKKKEMKKKLY